MQDKQHTPLPLVEGVDIVESEQDFQLKNTIIAAISQNRTHSDRLMSDSSSLVTTTSYVLVTSSTVVVIYLFSWRLFFNQFPHNSINYRYAMEKNSNYSISLKYELRDKSRDSFVQVAS